jgi:NAD-dependent deacetylase
MNPLPTVNIPEALTLSLHMAKTVTILTGAGISAESGIPTFRDSQTGLWEKYDPRELATPEAFIQNPGLVMDWYRWRRELVGKAEPNPGHFALAEMERRLPFFTLISQNIDGLHVRAGSKNIIELHGSLLRLRCSGVGFTREPRSTSACDYTTQEWPDEQLIHCPRCDALLRPDVVWFGEELQASALKAALHASRQCDVFFSVGTSGAVEPAASLPYEALRVGAAVIEINPNPTPLSIHSQYLFEQPAGVVLPQIVKAVWE